MTRVMSHIRELVKNRENHCNHIIIFCYGDKKKITGFPYKPILPLRPIPPPQPVI